MTLFAISLAGQPTGYRFGNKYPEVGPVNIAQEEQLVPENTIPAYLRKLSSTDLDTIQNDLAPEAHRPLWPLSTYGLAYEQSIVDGEPETSPEELRLYAVMAMKAYQPHIYVAHENEKDTSMRQAILNICKVVDEVYQFSVQQRLIAPIPKHIARPQVQPIPIAVDINQIKFEAVPIVVDPVPTVIDIFPTAVDSVPTVVKKAKTQERLSVSPSIRFPSQLHSIFYDFFTKPEKCKNLQNAEEADAQKLLNVLQMLLDDLRLEASARTKLLEALIRLSKSSALYPQCFTLTDVVQGDQPHAAGGFGEVWKGQFQEQVVCLKVAQIYQTTNIVRVLKSFSREAILWSRLSHPNVLPFYGIFHLKTMQRRFCLVSPWMDNGTLNEFLEENSTASRLLLVSDVIKGVRYLHSEGIVHGDLKGANILVSRSGRGYLADFGLSALIDTDMMKMTSIGTGASSVGGSGTVRWQAPELIDGDNENVRSTKASDIYAVAGVFYEIFTGKVPFYEIQKPHTVIYKIMNGQKPSRPTSESPACRDYGLTNRVWNVMDRCWESNPQDRLDAHGIIDELQINYLIDSRLSGWQDAIPPSVFRAAIHGTVDDLPADEMEIIISLISKYSNI